MTHHPQLIFRKVENIYEPERHKSHPRTEEGRTCLSDEWNGHTYLLQRLSPVFLFSTSVMHTVFFTQAIYDDTLARIPSH